MTWYLHRTPGLFRLLVPSMTWQVNTDQKALYLTFDDGPVRQVTDEVLELLGTYQAKATFFVVGENAKKNPSLIQKMLDDGHSIGNHTFNHLNGWQTGDEEYVNNVHSCQVVLQNLGVNTNLFRPPHGRISPGQLRALRGHYQVVMWSLLSGDFDKNLKSGRASKALQTSRPGEIVVFHDSLKHVGRMFSLLPDFLREYSGRGFKFRPLS